MAAQASQLHPNASSAPRSANPPSYVQEDVVPQSLAQQFATEYAKGVVPAMLKAIHTVKRNTKLVAGGAIAVSTPHQALYLAGLGHGSWTAWIFASIIPLVMDLGMLTMLTVTQTPGMHETARRRAMVVLAVMVLISAGVNAMAPGPIILRVLFAIVAGMLAAIEWVSSAVAPDFAAMEQHEQQTTATSVDPAAEAQRAARRQRDQARRDARREAQQRAAQADADHKAAAAERRRLARQVAELEQMAAGFVPADAPTSPAPGEAAAYL